MRSQLSTRPWFPTLVFLAGLTTFAGPAAKAEPHHHPSAATQAAQDYTRSVQVYEIPRVVVQGTDGKQTALGDELDRDQAVMMNFIFTSCRAVCPVMTRTFADVQKQLGEHRREVRLISISIDPEHDTPDRLRDYSGKHSIDDNWQFFTGALPDILAVQHAFDAYRGNKMNHVPVTFLRASRDAPWVRIEGFVNADDLIGEYHRLVAR